ncbi:hypothetical protein CGCVW01_v014232 [Colletotrichum viniferum]|nr:hypothetical protein CGCVW01_v014232 [Colletotrichum viniferum]
MCTRQLTSDLSVLVNHIYAHPKAGYSICRCGFATGNPADIQLYNEMAIVCYVANTYVASTFESHGMIAHAQRKIGMFTPFNTLQQNIMT